MVSHLIALLAAALIVAGPVPACLRFASRAAREGGATSFPQRLVLVLLGWCVAQMSVALVLGIGAALQLGGVLLAEAAVFAAGATGLSRIGLRREWEAWRAALPRLQAADTAVLIAIGTVGLMLLWQAVAQPVIDWDSWAFHLPSIARFVQTGSLVRLEQYAGRARVAYPYGWEAMCSLFVFPFAEDFLVTFPNLIAWSLLGLASYVLARSFGAARVLAAGATALLLAIPVVFIHVNTMHVDLPFAALVVAALCAARLYAQSRSPTWLAAVVLALGASSALRSTAALYVPVVAASLWPTRRSERRSAHGHGPVIAALLVAVVLGGFWYARNLVDFGSPFGAIGTSVDPAAPSPLLRIARLALIASADWSELASWRAFAQRVRGELGLPFALIAIFAGGTLAAGALPKARRRVRPAGPILLSLGTALIFWCTPTSGVSGAQIRLAMPFLACLATAGAVGATALRLRATAMAALSLLVAGLTCAASKVLYVAAGLLILGGVFRTPRSRWWRTVAVLTLGVLVFVGTVAARRWRADLRRGVYGDSYTFLDTEVPVEEPLAYLFTDRSYLLYGTSLRRPLYYAPFREGDDPNHWIADLEARGIHLVAIGPAPEASPRVVEVVARLAAPVGRLQPVHGRQRIGDLTIYRIAPPTSP